MACQLNAEIDAEGSIKILPNHDNPIAPGAICRKATSALEIFDHPDRILHPQERVGERGENRWETISWDQALDEIAAKLEKLIAHYDSLSNQPEAVSHMVQADTSRTVLGHQ
jgi:anaerobic selenocysteine-containing dehydrogenase